MTTISDDPSEQSTNTRLRKSERLLTLVWSGIENTCRQILSLVFFFISVRFLHPADLGLFAVALAFSSVALTVIDDPIGEALVQKDDTTTADWNTGFTINLILSATLTVIVAAVAWPLSLVLNEPALRLALPVLASSLVIGSLGNIQKALLARMLRFRTIAQTTLIAQIGGGIASITLAVLGFGYWALIANVLLPVTINSAIYATISPWKPRLEIDRATIVSRLPYTVYSAAIRSIYLVRDQSPLLIAGLFVDLAQVGFLSLALRVARSVSQLFEEVTGRPLLSLMSREQHDIRQFGQALIEVLTIVGVFAVPGFVGLAIVGPRLIALAFGAKWAPAGAFLPWICIVLAGWLMLHIVLVSLRAQEQGRLAVQLTIPAALIDAAILIIFIPLGMKWALMLWAGRAVLTLPVAVHVLRKRLGVPLQALAQRLAFPLLASAIMGLVLVFATRVQILGSGFVNIGTTIMLGCLTYGIFLVTTMPALRGQLLSKLALSRS